MYSLAGCRMFVDGEMRASQESDCKMVKHGIFIAAGGLLITLSQLLSQTPAKHKIPANNSD